jgi:hypothetical protein
MNGNDAVNLLETLTTRVSFLEKDKNDKFWSYKLKTGKRTEFAFDPRTTTRLLVRVDREPPSLAGISGIRRIAGDDVSTALGRVFSGGIHKANYFASIEDESALLALIEHYESL